MFKKQVDESTHESTNIIEEKKVSARRTFKLKSGSVVIEPYSITPVVILILMIFRVWLEILHIVPILKFILKCMGKSF